MSRGRYLRPPSTGFFGGHDGSRDMHLRRALLLSVGFGLIATRAFATPNATPNLKTGDYQAQWGALTVGDPSVYSRVNVSAAIHPTTVHYDAASGTYVFNDGRSKISFSRSEYVSSKSSPAYSYYVDTTTGATLNLLKQSATNPV